MTKNKKDKKDISEDDFSTARQNYHFLITKIQDDIEKMSELAEDSSHPRAYEVLANMYKIAADMNDKLLEHNRKKQIIDEKKAESGQLDPTGDTAYLGSTVELQRKLLEDRKKKKETPKEEVEEAEIVEETEDEQTESSQS